MKWFLIVFVLLAACVNETKRVADNAEVRLIQEPTTMKCFVVVATSLGVAMAPVECPPPTRPTPSVTPAAPTPEAP
jgi:hypothetical protein